MQVAGLLAHTRMKHKLRKEKVSVEACRCTVAADGTLSTKDEEEENEEEAPPPPQPPAKKLKIVLKMASRPE